MHGQDLYLGAGLRVGHEFVGELQRAGNRVIDQAACAGFGEAVQELAGVTHGIRVGVACWSSQRQPGPFHPAAKIQLSL